MREHKYRGQRTDNKKWVYGSLHYEEVECEKQYFQDGANNHYLCIDVRPVIEVDDDSNSERLTNYAVIPSTVGEFTGILDKHKKEICEGDIVRVVELLHDEIRVYETDIKWEDGAFVMKSGGEDYDTFITCFTGNPATSYPAFDIEIIGTIHDQAREGEAD